MKHFPVICVLQPFPVLLLAGSPGRFAQTQVPVSRKWPSKFAGFAALVLSVFGSSHLPVPAVEAATGPQRADTSASQCDCRKVADGSAARGRPERARGFLGSLDGLATYIKLYCCW